MSPRSGTPVKLLGREDASVDWYNLEKSRRVKPFRCGEFDACIERAESSQGVPIKKREKYARREDAILHALELEKQHLEGQRQKYVTNSNTVSHKYSGNLKKMMNSCSSSGLYPRDNEPINSVLQSQSRRVGLPFEELSEGMPLHVQRGKHGKQMNWEDDNSALLPRTSGLQDFGPHMAPPKRKEPSSAPCESSQPALSDNHVDDIPNSGHGIEGVNDTGGVKNSIGVKRKRSDGALMEESLVEGCDRRRPLIRVLQNSIKLSAKSLQGNSQQTSDVGKEKKEQFGAVCDAKKSWSIYLPANSSDHYDHTGHSSDQMQMSPTAPGYSNGLHQPGLLAGEDASSGLIGEGDTSSSEGDYLVADLDEEIALHQDAKSIIHGSRNSDGHASKCVSVLGDQEKLGKINNDYGTSPSDYKVRIVSNDWTAGSGDMGLSKWRMKGKRNFRNLARKSMEVFNGNDSVMSSDNCSGSLNGSVEKKQCVFKTGWEELSGQGLYHKDEELNYVYDDDEFFETENRLIGFGKHSYPLMLKTSSRDRLIYGINDSDEDSHRIFSSAWEANEPPHLAQRAYWEESGEFLDAHFICPLNVDMAPQLVDVNLKVQASYQGEHVPLVSLMSRLNGKAIIGHPVHIEILEDGSTDSVCPRNHSGVNATAVDELAAPTAWRTGKRTSMQRVPRLHLGQSAQGESSGFIRYYDGEGRSPFKKSYSASTHWTCLLKSSNDGKFNKKPSKKASLPSQKSRTVSSIATEKKCNHVSANAKLRRKEGSILDGLIIPGGTVPLVTCVPVKVVFTRILEVVGRPPSASMTRQALLARSIQRASS